MPDALNTAAMQCNRSTEDCEQVPKSNPAHIPAHALHMHSSTRAPACIPWLACMRTRVVHTHLSVPERGICSTSTCTGAWPTTGTDSMGDCHAPPPACMCAQDIFWRIALASTSASTHDFGERNDCGLSPCLSHHPAHMHTCIVRGIRPGVPASRGRTPALAQAPADRPVRDELQGLVMGLPAHMGSQRNDCSGPVCIVVGGQTRDHALAAGGALGAIPGQVICLLWEDPGASVEGYVMTCQCGDSWNRVNTWRAGQGHGHAAC